MTENSEQKKKRGIPEWSSSPLRLFIEDMDQFTKLLHLSINAISIMPARPNLIKVLAKIEETEESDQNKRRLAQAEDEARLAQEEIEAGFPLLHSQALIWLWTTLESTIRNMVAIRFEKDPICYQAEQVKRLRIKLGEYEGLTAEERSLYVVDLFEREVGAPLKAGVGRFESLLEPIGMGGVVPEQIRRTIFELSQVRNLLVHRRGIVDRRFLEKCPWFGVKLADPIIISHQQFTIYMQAIFAYTSELVQRLRIYYGHDRDIGVEENIKQVEEMLTRFSEKDAASNSS